MGWLDSDKLFIAETALITIPFSLISAFYAVVSLYFFLFLPTYFPYFSERDWVNLAIWAAVLAASILSLVAIYSLSYLSWKYIFGDSTGLGSVKGGFWAFAALGAVIGLLSVVNLMLIMLNTIDPNFLIIYAFGAPLLIPFFHLKWIVKKSHEACHA
jgi:hypothetical protein